MGVIAMDMEQMETLANNLQMIHDAFLQADSATEGWGPTTGETYLAGRVETFADKWRMKREAMLESMKSLQNVIGQVTLNFTEVDNSLTDSFIGPSQP